MEGEKGNEETATKRNKGKPKKMKKGEADSKCAGKRPGDASESACETEDALEPKER